METIDYSIKDKEDELFSIWKQHHEDFCPNGGLLFRGNFGINPIANDNGEFTWNRMPSNDEEILWCKSDKRLMVLSKDLNDTELWDIRQESGGRKHLKQNQMPSEEKLLFTGAPFKRKLNRWVYGIYKEYRGEYPSFEEVKDYKKMGLFYEQTPLVRINCKIELGTNCVKNEVLKESMESNKSFLIKQIKLYKANIILCCGYTKKEGNVILKFLTENYLNDIKVIEGSGDWIYYSESKKIVIINSFHPSCRGKGKSDEWLYNELVKNFSQSVSNLDIIFSPLT